MSYEIIRHYQNHSNSTIRRGLTLDEAQEHCRDPESSSSTCAEITGLNRTESMGDWFDGYAEE